MTRAHVRAAAAADREDAAGPRDGHRLRGCRRPGTSPCCDAAGRWRRQRVGLEGVRQRAGRRVGCRPATATRSSRSRRDSRAATAAAGSMNGDGPWNRRAPALSTSRISASRHAGGLALHERIADVVDDRDGAVILTAGAAGDAEPGQALEVPARGTEKGESDLGIARTVAIVEVFPCRMVCMARFLRCAVCRRVTGRDGHPVCFRPGGHGAAIGLAVDAAAVYFCLPPISRSSHRNALRPFSSRRPAVVYHHARAADGRAAAAAGQSILDGRHTLIAAPTGSGKTLAAFLAALDELTREGLRRSRCPTKSASLYVSPLKALSADIHKNLAEPRRGILRLADEAGLAAPRITAAVRTGDTTQGERAAMLRTPPHILVTTPESLYLLLTVRAQPADAAHRAHGHRRRNPRRDRHAARRASGALARAAARTSASRPLLRIGLSATQKPIDEVGALPRRRNRRGRAPSSTPGIAARWISASRFPALAARRGDGARGLGGVPRSARGAHHARIARRSSS